MDTKNFDNIVLVFFDDNTEKPKREKFLEVIFDANNLHLSDEERAMAKERFNKNRNQIIEKYRLQGSVYFVKLHSPTTYEMVEQKFKLFIDNGLILSLCKASKITASSSFFNKF